ncbi:MATE family efflux transporter [Halorubrum sp. GN11_10-6_MGM]|uniref:MATE family efflux transporter n=1 Tax=Halorubrum sp. GN11_10-6_MGM TaxID=2518112 RepID=UPI0010F936AE|nr:MATE family efflux transporter [Halorubrum sp. GN11_10-6_MGM]
MTTGRISPRLFRLAWPLVLGNLLQTLYNLADMFWVGRVSTEAVAAVSLMFPLSWMFVSTAMGVTAATIAVVSQHVGAGNDRRADEVVAQTCLLATVVSLVLAAVGFLARHRLLYWIGARDQVFVEALAYIEVIFATLPLTFLFFAFRASLQGAGDTKTAMWLVAASAGLNIVIDPVFILGWNPAAWLAGLAPAAWSAALPAAGALPAVPAMGTRGAALATLVSRLFATAVGVGILLRGDWGIRLRPRDLRPNPAVLRKLVSVGYPATLDGWARSFAAVAMAALVARFGAAATAAYGIGVRLMSVSWTVSGAVGQATSTGVGQNLGAGTPDRAVAVTRVATVATMAILFAAGGLVWAFPAPAMRVFVADPETVAEGVRFLRIVALSWGFFGGLMVIQGAFRGAGSTEVAMALSLLSRWAFRIPIAALLAFGTVTLPVVGVTYTGLDWGVAGLWWAYTAAAVASFAVGVGWFLRGTWTESVVDEAERDPDVVRDVDSGDAADGSDPVGAVDPEEGGSDTPGDDD